MADAPKDPKPAAAPAAAAPKPSGGGGKKKKAKGKDDITSDIIEQPPIKYGHGADDRPARQDVRATERAARLKSLQADAGAALAPALAKLTGDVVRDDPILSALLRVESARQGLNRAVNSEAGGTRLAGAEEPSDVADHTVTERMRAVLAKDLAAMPAGTQARFIAAEEPDEEINTDVESGDEAVATYEAAYKDILVSQRPAMPVLRSLPSAAAEDDARVGEMARALLSGVDLPKRMAETAALIASEGGDMAAAASVGLRLVRDEAGRKRSPEEVAGLGRGRSRLVDAALGAFTGVEPSVILRAEGEEALADTFGPIEDDSEEESFGRRVATSWGSDPRAIPQGLLEDVLNPMDFTAAGEEEEEGEEIDTLREALMSPAERNSNSRRKVLKELIEAPQPIATRPAWPLYALIAGVDQVQQVTSGGMVASARCMVVVGNGMGGVGVGMVKHPEAEAATKKALARAIRDMVFVGSHKGQLYHDLIGKKNNVYVLLRTVPASAEIASGAPLIADVLELAGIERYSAKIIGSHKGRRNPYIVTQALFDAFNHHYPPEREAALRGMRPVWATADRVTRHNVYPQTSQGPRFPPANSRFQDTGRARA
jgi:ribosomal protein S5